MKSIPHRLKRVAALGLGTSIILSSGTGAYASMPDDNGKAPAHSQKEKPEEVENIIYMIPDGFDAAYATNYRHYKGEEAPVWDEFLTGMMKTDSADNLVTDSAAAGTAMARGVKTENGMIGMTPEGDSPDSILQKSGDAGKSTGLVATSTITHATPAVFGSSVEDRNNEAAIAPQLLENVDVLMGGGRNMFLPESEGGEQEQDNLIEKAEMDGFTYTENLNDIQASEEEKILGLFDEEAMSPELERPEEQPSLSEMTTSAIQSLEKDEDGFFLMVEGSQIDWAGHAHDAAWAMTDTEAFEMAVQEAVDYAEAEGNTLVVVAGDHETGGMTVGGYDEYMAKPEVLRDVTATGNKMASELNDDASNAAEVLSTFTGIDITDEEAERIQNAEDEETRASEINSIVSEYAYVGWGTSQHTGTDVPLYAYGAGSEEFTGLLDNTELPEKMSALISQ